MVAIVFTIFGTETSYYVTNVNVKLKAKRGVEVLEQLCF